VSSKKQYGAGQWRCQWWTIRELALRLSRGPNLSWARAGQGRPGAGVVGGREGRADEADGLAVKNIR
jgi:hypothetical protein